MPTVSHSCTPGPQAVPLVEREKPETTVDRPDNVVMWGTVEAAGSYPLAVCRFSLSNRTATVFIWREVYIWFGYGEFICTVHRGMLQDRTVICLKFEEKDGGIKERLAALPLRLACVL